MKGCKILVAEDEAIIALDLKIILETHSFVVIGTARTYEGVAKRIKEHSPDLLISTISLKNSKDYFDKIVALQKEYKFSVLFLSSHLSTEKYKEKCDTHFFNFIKKPFDSEILISTINSFKGIKSNEQT